MRRLRSILGLVVVLMVTSVIGYAGYERFGPKPVQAAIPTMLPVQRGNLTATVSAAGNVAAPTLAKLGFKSSGTLNELLIDVGSEVRVGQVLARLDTTALESTLRQSRASFHSATTQLADLKDGLSPIDQRLSEASVTSAKLKLAQVRANTTDIRNAEGNLESAKLKLQELKAAGSGQEIATARLQLAAAKAKFAVLKEPAARDIQHAEASVASAQARLNQHLQPRVEDVQNAEASVASAQARLDQYLQPRVEDVQNAEASVGSAQAKLDRLRNPSADDVRTAEASVASAQAKLDRLNKPLSEDVRIAEASVASAQAKLDKVMRPTETDLAAARVSLDQAKIRLAELTDAPSAQPEDIANSILSVQKAQLNFDQAVAENQSEINVAQARISLQTAQNNLAKVQAQGPSNWQLRLQQLSVKSAQDGVDRLLHPSPADIASAEASLLQAQSNLQQLLHPSPADIASAEASLLQVQSNLQQLLNPTPDAIAAAKASTQQAESSLQKLLKPSASDIASAQASLRQAQTSLQKLLNPSAFDVASAEASLRQAQTSLEKLIEPGAADLANAQVSVLQAEQVLDKLLHPDPVAIAQQELTVAQSERQLIRAKANHADALASAGLGLEQAQLQHELKVAPATAQQLAAAESSVEGARVQLEQAQRNLANATLRAPFAGLVATVSASLGEQVGSAEVIQLVDPRKIRIEVQVDETDVSSISAGQTANLTFEGLPNRRIPGTVLVVAPTGSITQGVVNYQVIVELDRGRAAGVRPGMTATASIVTEARDNVIVVTNRAIRRQGRRRTVEIMTDSGETETREVEIGLANDRSSEILRGLQPGDTVVIPTTTTGQTRIPGLTGSSGGRGSSRRIG